MWRRTWLTLRRKPFQTLLIFVMMAVVGVAVFSSLTMLSAIDQTRLDTISQVGATLFLGNSTD